MPIYFTPDGDVVSNSPGADSLVTTTTSWEVEFQPVPSALRGDDIQAGGRAMLECEGCSALILRKDGEEPLCKRCAPEKPKWYNPPLPLEDEKPRKSGRKLLW